LQQGDVEGASKQLKHMSDCSDYCPKVLEV